MAKKNKIGKISEGLSDKEEELSKEYYNAMIATNKRSLVKKYGKKSVVHNCKVVYVVGLCMCL